MMYHKIREYRHTKPLFTVDFWNDGEYVGGCIAGGRSYCHINANGDIEPCPVLDNPGRLTDIVEKSGAKSADYQNLESAKEILDKCVDAAANWTPVADRLWMA